MSPDPVALLATYDSAVFTGFDRTGLPVSLRCVPRPGDGGLLRIEIPEWVDLVEGRAGLLAHFHDEGLWHQRSFVCRGRVARDGDVWTFVPEATVIGMGHRPFGLIRALFEGRRRTAAYLARRGWGRPSVPWDLMKQVKREAFSGRRQGRARAGDS